MTILAVVLAVLCGLVFLVWTSRHLLINHSKRHDVPLTADLPGPPRPAPRVSVLVAAKDEEANIGACVESMLRQDYPDFEVLVIDDRSADRTAEVVEAIAARDPRVRLVRIRELPDGWCGKNHAMWQGARHATGEWLCMIDADCRQTCDRTLSVTVQHALDRGADLLSVLPTLEMKGFWENVVQPVCSGVMIIWFKPDAVNDPARPQAYANGAFMLMRRDAYEAIGTHEAVRMCVNEDMHMALRTKRAGRRLVVVQNRGLYLVRMYTSLQQIVNGWSRIFYGTFGTTPRLIASIAVLGVMSMLPYLVTPLGWIAWAATGRGAWLAAALAGTAAMAMQLSVIVRFYRLTGGAGRLAWAYVVGCSVAMVSLVKALGKRRRGGQIVWRNTTYSTGATKTEAPVP